MSETPDFAAFEHDGWERAAAAYLRGFFALTREVASPMLDAAAVRAGDRVLDVATGHGDAAAVASGRGAQVTGVDFAGAMLTLARRRNPHITFEHADAQALPYDDASFDVVTMAFLLGHLGDPARALAEARRVLAPGGRIALTWWGPFARARGFGLVYDAVVRHGRTDVNLPPGPPFDQFSDPDVLTRALGEAKFGAVTVRELPLLWRLGSADEMFDAFLHGTVRTAGLLRAQAPAVQAAIRAELAEAVKPFARAGRIEIPMPAWLASGVAR